MFDEFIRELRRLERPVRIPIDIPVDDNGYIDRQCPHNDCEALFKVLFDDWRNKVPDTEAYCPKCGVKEDPTNFNTKYQKKYIKKAAKAYAVNRVNRALKRATQRTKPRRFSNALMSFQIHVSYHASPVQVVLPPSASAVLRQDFWCELCSCQYSTVGSGYFCPACGHNSAINDFERNINTIYKTIDGLEEIKQALSDKYDPDTASNVVEKLLENQVEDIVTSFQRVVEALFRKLPNAESFTLNQNLFQRLSEGSDLWCRATGKGYDRYLSKFELQEMAMMFQRRHSLTHNEGMVDQRYVNKSGDRSYAVGQRLVIRKTHVKRLAAIVRKLVCNLQETVVADIELKES